MPARLIYCLRPHNGVLVHAHDQGKVVAEVCHAGWMLVSVGIFRGKTVTSTPANKDDVVNAGAEWVDREVIKDDKLAISRKPDDLPAFCREITTELERGRHRSVASG